MNFEPGQRIVLPPSLTPSGLVTVQGAIPTEDGLTLFVKDDKGDLRQVTLDSEAAEQIQPLTADGSAPSARVLAGMWTRWMSAAASNASTTMLASSPLRPYAHQATAVYGAMLPQPMLRFLLADEPGTGKTIMAGLWLREMQRLGMIRRALIIAPANLAAKWVKDFERLLGGGLRRITADTVREGGLDGGHDMWVVSLELAAMNPAVLDAIRPDKVGWDAIVFDEAHRYTPTATSFHQVARLLARNTPRVLMMTATPHRGSEWLFRHLLHLVDPDVYPDPGAKDDGTLSALRPGTVHFLRRMKEDLVDYDGVTRLFHGRTAHNLAVPLTAAEHAIYTQALDMVDVYFPPSAQPLARMVYGKRAGSALHALAETLRRRQALMGSKTEAEADLDAARDDEADDATRDEAKVVNAASQSSRAEQKAITAFLAEIDALLAGGAYEPSKWKALTNDCLRKNGIVPGRSEQAVIFTEYADSAEWIVKRLRKDGYTAEPYSGRIRHKDREIIRSRFMAGEFQIIVTTDAGNEGIDLQAAHVLVNYDIPWSLVKLEQRMGRIHRVGQTRDVHLYNLIALDTREGDTMRVLLDNFVNAANELSGQMFDSLSAVAELTGIKFDQWMSDLIGRDPIKRDAAEQAAKKVQSVELKRRAQQIREDEARLSSTVDAMAALTLLQNDLLERINPAIVETYLARLQDADLLTATPHALGVGFRYVEATAAHPLPATFGDGNHAIVATSGDALERVAKSPDAVLAASHVVTLGPGEPPFTDLIRLAETALTIDMHRAGAAEDPTSVTGYDLYSYGGTLVEAGGKKTTRWATLIRVNDDGTAYPVRWETLANLVPATHDGGAPHLARQAAADIAANNVAATMQTEQSAVRQEWLAGARKDLRKLPTELTPNVAYPKRQERLAERGRLQTQVDKRLTDLEALAAITVNPPVQTGRLRVHPAAIPATPQETGSELIAMRRITSTLEADGWTVSDVSKENRGYDLHARRRHQQRLIEVKGVWQSAASNGIRMTGNEVLIATQHGSDYWLYVVDQCHNGTGVVYGVYRDPARLFHGQFHGDAIFSVPGSSLATHRIAGPASPGKDEA
ncbi:helicase [Micromonospora globispora]|uniref:Helicase n=1 Tax=Micromonospora globispora TaxID=1450148 RepID=A0A317K761_9ACTN|nr:helicase-related protein [Micromonospora globispora]PWU48913.1 helicase [Micromonospora globispora]